MTIDLHEFELRARRLNISLLQASTSGRSFKLTAYFDEFCQLVDELPEEWGSHTQRLCRTSRRPTVGSIATATQLDLQTESVDGRIKVFALLQRLAYTLAAAEFLADRK
jgi:hypothetical protein